MYEQPLQLCGACMFTRDRQIAFQSRRQNVYLPNLLISSLISLILLIVDWFLFQSRCLGDGQGQNKYRTLVKRSESMTVFSFCLGWGQMWCLMREYCSSVQRTVHLLIPFMRPLLSIIRALQLWNLWSVVGQTDIEPLEKNIISYLGGKTLWITPWPFLYLLMVFGTSSHIVYNDVLYPASW
jgi:hypothetical protein